MMEGGPPPAIAETMPGLLGVEWIGLENGASRVRLDVRPGHMSPNGLLHAGAVVTLADSACGFGCLASLPEGATGFTTVELKTNFLGTAKAGDAVVCAARRVHAGRTTQVWDAEVVNQTTHRTIALFRCTQLVLWPR